MCAFVLHYTDKPVHKGSEVVRARHYGIAEMTLSNSLPSTGSGKVDHYKCHKRHAV